MLASRNTPLVHRHILTNGSSSTNQQSFVFTIRSAMTSIETSLDDSFRRRLGTPVVEIGESAVRLSSVFIQEMFMLDGELFEETNVLNAFNGEKIRLNEKRFSTLRMKVNESYVDAEHRLIEVTLHSGVFVGVDLQGKLFSKGKVGQGVWRWFDRQTVQKVRSESPVMRLMFVAGRATNSYST